jgi:c-di-GMP-related signal transduction protein
MNIKLTYDYTLDSIKVVREKTGRLSLAIRSIASAVILLGLDEILTISIPVL